MAKIRQVITFTSSEEKLEDDDKRIRNRFRSR